jgi:dihydroorotase/N-acyl-D-amino-acid deacylase
MRRSPSLLAIAALSAILAACAQSAADADARGAAAQPSSYDVLITNGRVVDGTGNAWFTGDVAIAGDRIARIAPPGRIAPASAKQVIDARGLVVAPGFIDIQAQSLVQFTVGDGRVVSMVTQGVTTAIMGEGESPAPANDALIKASPDTTLAKAMQGFRGPDGFAHWLDAMQRHGMSENAGSFLGAATVRVYAKGYAQGAPTAAELDTMRAVVRDAMKGGAFGVASALIYPPGNFAGTPELIEMAKAMAPYGGVYITHMRSEADKLLEAIDEAMRIGKEGGVPVEIYHLKAAGVKNWDKAAKAVAKIDSARAAGQDVSADMYPYVAGGTGLAACIPPWATADGKLLANLKDAATRQRITSEITRGVGDWENLCVQATPEGVMLAGITEPSLKKFEGKRLSEVASSMGKPWVDALIDFLIADQARTGMVVFLMKEENVAMQLRQPWIKIGTDADGWDPDSAKGVMVHPRTYGTYPRILGKYVRDEHVLPLEDAVRKMTSAVANRLSIRDRGQLREGMFADVVIFDPATIIDRATFTAPHQISTGVRDVFVNGVAVVRDGKHTGAKPGRVVRGPGWTGVAQ